MVRLTVNGKEHEIDVEPDTPLLWVLREDLGLLGTKYSCGIGQCGACTVIVDGEAVGSCVISAQEAEGHDITTIEGLNGPIAEALIEAWAEFDVPQCGYCQPGQIMTAAALLASNPSPSDEEIDSGMSRVLCRCGTYPEIRKAVRKAASR